VSPDFKEELRAFIIDSFLFGAADELPGHEESLIEAEVIDSTGVLELVAFMEDTLGISVDEDDITPANFDSITGLVAYASRQTDSVRT